MSTDQHNVEMCSSFIAGGWWCECSCGWKSRTWADRKDAIGSGAAHSRTVSR